MILIDGVLLEEEILSKKFCCDLAICKGACCTFYGEYGAPVEDQEVQLIKDSYQAAKKYLSERSVKHIEKHGMIDGMAGGYMTECIEKKDCVFVYYEGDIAFCALERAYLNGESDFWKPISCHLFPIRVSLGNNQHLYFSEIPECSPALKKGKKDEIYLFEMLKGALIRKFGNSWYDNFIKYVKFNNINE